MTNDELITACREIANLHVLSDTAADMGAEDLTTDEYDLFIDVEHFANTKINRLCGALRAAIVKATGIRGIDSHDELLAALVEWHGLAERGGLPMTEGVRHCWGLTRAAIAKATP